MNGRSWFRLPEVASGLGVLAALAMFVVLAVSPAALANDERDRGEGETFESLAVRGGIGFMEGPDAFLAAFDFEGLVSERVGVGLGLQLGVEDEFIVVSPTLFTRYRFSLASLENQYLRKIRPFAQLGLGLTHIDVERRGNDRDGTDFMFNFGGGFDYPVDENVELGTRILISLIPGEVLDQRVYFSWELISVRYRW